MAATRLHVELLELVEAVAQDVEDVVVVVHAVMVYYYYEKVFSASSISPRIEHGNERSTSFSR